jgi:hypothetical protein
MSYLTHVSTTFDRKTKISSIVATIGDKISTFISIKKKRNEIIDRLNIKIKQLEIEGDKCIENDDEMYIFNIEQIKFIKMQINGLVGHQINYEQNKSTYIDKITQTHITGKPINLHHDENDIEYVSVQTAIHLINSNQDKFYFNGTEIICPCPCVVINKKTGKITDNVCGKNIYIRYLIAILPIKYNLQLLKSIKYREHNIIREYYRKSKFGCVDCMFCVDPGLTDGFGMPLCRELRSGQIFRSNVNNIRQCITCGKTWCAKCNVPYHFGKLIHDDLNCEAVIAIKRGQDPSEAVIRTISKKCPNCSANVKKISGCNHITCICGADFCYVCTTHLILKNYCPSCKKRY